MSTNKRKVTAYIPEELNTQMWSYISQSTDGSSTYGAVSNFVTNAVISYLADPYHAEFIKDNSTPKDEEEDKCVE